MVAFICLSVSNITQKFMNGLQWKIMEGSKVVKESKGLNFGSNLDHDPALADVCALEVLGYDDCGHLMSKVFKIS